MKKKKYIEPQYLYDENNKLVEVYLSAEDYQAFMGKLQALSKKMEQRQQEKKNRSSQSKK